MLFLMPRVQRHCSVLEIMSWEFNQKTQLESIKASIWYMLFYYCFAKLFISCYFAWQVREIPVELQKLFVRLLLLNQQSAEVNALTNSFGWKSNEVLVLIRNKNWFGKGKAHPAGLSIWIKEGACI